MILRYVCNLLLVFALTTLLSCAPNFGKNLDNRDEDLYNRVGYRPGHTPADYQSYQDSARDRQSGNVKVVPDYYYRKADRVANRPPAQRAKKVVSVKYEPSSRHYNNPYSFKPPLNFPYFDSDQYYVPPRGYNGRGHDSHNEESGYQNGRSGSKNDELY